MPAVLCTALLCDGCSSHVITRQEPYPHACTTAALSVPRRFRAAVSMHHICTVHVHRIGTSIPLRVLASNPDPVVCRGSRCSRGCACA